MRLSQRYSLAFSSIFSSSQTTSTELSYSFILISSSTTVSPVRSFILGEAYRFKAGDIFDRLSELSKLLLLNILSSKFQANARECFSLAAFLMKCTMLFLLISIIYKKSRGSISLSTENPWRLLNFSEGLNSQQNCLGLKWYSSFS